MSSGPLPRPVKVAIRCLRRLVQDGPADVTRAAALELDKAALNLLLYIKQQRHTEVGANDAEPLPAGVLKGQVLS
jgi:hypothetical protein